MAPVVRKDESSDGQSSVCVGETLTGKRGIVDLWYYFHELIDDSELLAAHEALMTPDEHQRHRSFRFEDDRRLFLATRALVRTVLSSYAPVAPADWRFAYGKNGKPRIAHPAVTPRLNFNLANTRGLVVCLVSVAHESIGVDVEMINRDVPSIGLANSYFCPSEVRALRALPASDQPRRFFSYWTLKESYIKARGIGLSLPLHQFSFHFEDDAIRITFDAQLADDATRWRFALLDAPPCHMTAVGVDTGGVALSLRTTHVVPLHEKRRSR
jgi:4'-phosphopantetheinyl transferase